MNADQDLNVFRQHYATIDASALTEQGDAQLLLKTLRRSLQEVEQLAYTAAGSPEAPAAYRSCSHIVPAPISNFTFTGQQLQQGLQAMKQNFVAKHNDAVQALLAQGKSEESEEVVTRRTQLQLWETLSSEQVLDLVGYLRTTKQVELP